MSNKMSIQRENSIEQKLFNSWVLSFFYLACLLAIIIVVSGCQQYSPSHSSGNPWLVSRELSQTTNVLDFKYTGYVQDGQASCKGEAVISPEFFPDWAKYYEQASIAIYITDQNGRILEKHEQEYVPGSLIAEPLEFDFELDSPIRLDDRNFYISFGYYLILSEFDPTTTQGGRKVIRLEAVYN